MATGSINKIKNPTIPNKEPPLVIRTRRDKMVTIIRTGTTTITPFLTTFLPEVELENNPKVKEPNNAGIKYSEAVFTGANSKIGAI